MFRTKRHRTTSHKYDAWEVTRSPHGCGFGGGSDGSGFDSRGWVSPDGDGMSVGSLTEYHHVQD
jgi:hypothetical protein